MDFVFQNFLIRATITEISVKNGVWGPFEWVGDQLTGWEDTQVNFTGVGSRDTCVSKNIFLLLHIFLKTEMYFPTFQGELFPLT